MSSRMVLWLPALFRAAPLHPADHTIIPLYHNVGDRAPASTSVTPAVFRRHPAYLDAGGHTVLPPSKMLGMLGDCVARQSRRHHLR